MIVDVSGRRLGGTTMVAAFTMFLLLGMLTAALGASLPLLRLRFDEPAGLDKLISLYNLGALTAILGCGLLRRRVRPGLLIASGHIVFTTGCLGLALSPSWAGYLVAVFVAGAGMGALNLFLNTVVARAYGTRAVIAVNILNAVFGIGAVMGPVLIGGLGPAGVRLLPAAMVLLAVPCFIVHRAGHILDAGPARPRGRGSRRAGAGAPLGVLVPFMGVSFLYAGTETSIGGWETTYLTWTGFSDGAAARYAAGFWAGLTVGRLVLPALLIRLAPHRALQIYLVLASGALAVAMVPAAAPVAFGLTGLAFAPILPTTIAWLSQVANRPETANSWLLTASMVGNAALPALVGTVAEESWPPAIPLLAAAGCLLCLIVVTLAGRAVTRSGVQDTSAGDQPRSNRDGGGSRVVAG